MPTDKTTTSKSAPEAAMPQADPAATGQNPTDINTELSINDLAAIRSIIDIASQRGAFKPAEMVAIGTVYGKLDKFLNTIQKAQAQNV
jgi:hypothetical protein